MRAGIIKFTSHNNKDDATIPNWLVLKTERKNNAVSPLTPSSAIVIVGTIAIAQNISHIVNSIFGNEIKTNINLSKRINWMV